MTKRGRPRKTTLGSIEPAGEREQRTNLISPDEITAEDIKAVEVEACSRSSMWGQLAPERVISAVINAMEVRR
jgi:hypothetical protein